MKQFYLLIFILLSYSSIAQIEEEQTVSTGDYRLDSIVSHTMTGEIEEVVIKFRSDKETRKLRRDVAKAYPYALRVASVVEQIDKHASTIDNKRNKRRYLKKKEKWLKSEFEDNLKLLTKTQGRYMVRLINRETDNTVYNLIKQYKSGLSATFWQMIAKRFESDLKAVYSPDDIESIDYDIEFIVEDYSDYYKKKIKSEIVVDAPTYRDFQ